MPKVKRILSLAGFLMTSAATVSCGSYPTSNLDDQLIVGEYLLTPGIDAGQFASFVTLSKDKAATEVHVDRLTGATRVIQTQWKTSLGPTLYVEIGNRAYPVWRHGTAVTLVVDDDRGTYFEKVPR